MVRLRNPLLEEPENRTVVDTFNSSTRRKKNCLNDAPKRLHIKKIITQNSKYTLRNLQASLILPESSEGYHIIKEM